MRMYRVTVYRHNGSTWEIPVEAVSGSDACAQGAQAFGEFFGNDEQIGLVTARKMGGE